MRALFSTEMYPALELTHAQQHSSLKTLCTTVVLHWESERTRCTCPQVSGAEADIGFHLKSLAVLFKSLNWGKENTPTRRN